MTSGAKRALVTGGAAGLGKALCEALTHQGWQVVCVDRDDPADSRLHWLRCDLADREAVDALVTKLETFAPFDLATFNAGINATGHFERIDPSRNAALLRINTESALVLASALLNAGRIAPSGSIAFIASLSVATGYPGASTYAASKEAVAVYARSLRKRLRKTGINVLTVFPGPIRTDHAARHAPPGADETRRMAPQELALRVLAAVDARKAELYPGRNAQLAALAGRLAPKLVTSLMRRVLYDRMKGET